jgi:hypothetical protein
MRTANPLAPMLMILLATSACTTQGLAFVQDRRVEIVAPGYRELVEFPVTVDWEVESAELEDELASGVTFGVFVDIDPQPPGEPMEYFARDDQQCLDSPSCPDAKYLGDRGIRTTSETEMTFETLPIGPGVDLERGDPDFHEVIIVLLDEDGVRVGESAWRITFEIDREVN